MSELRMFSAGEQVVYAGRGLAKISGVEEVRVGGQVALMYVVVLAGSAGVSPVLIKVKMGVSKLRPVASPDEAREALLVFNQRPIKTTSWNRRRRGLLEKIEGGLLVEVAEVVRDLEVRRFMGRLAFTERAALDRARALFFPEASASLGVSPGDLEAEVAERAAKLAALEVEA